MRKRENFITLPDKPGAKPGSNRARVNPLEYRLLLMISSAEGMNLSETARLCVREAARARGFLPITHNGNSEINHDDRPAT